MSQLSGEQISEEIINAGLYKSSWDKPKSEWSISEQGRISPMYCNLRSALADVGLRTILQDQLVSRLHGVFVETARPDVITGIATAGLALSGFASNALELPMGYARATVKIHGLGGVLEGQFKEGTETHVIDDVFLTGNTITTASLHLANEGVSVTGITTLLHLSEEAGYVHQPDGSFRDMEVTALANYFDMVNVSVLKGLMTDDQGDRMLSYYQNPTTQPWD
jgi:orotate phosphoribosyltransferase